VPPDVLEAHAKDYGSADLEPEFLQLYETTAKQLGEIMHARASDVVILSGEGMLALWSALRSCIRPGDRVLSVATGVFGAGIASMARKCGAVVRVVEFAANSTVSDADWTQVVAAAVCEFAPRMITAVHCETPSGTLNPLHRLKELTAQCTSLPPPLIYVDAVSSIGGAELRVDEWGIDLALGGSQKCMSCPPTLAWVAVSPRAWRAIEEVQYDGYDALLPWRNGAAAAPYTHNWHGMAALHLACEKILREGVEACWVRHTRVAEHCRHRLAELGLPSFYAPGAVPSPTVTAVPLPAGLDWPTLDAEFRSRGVIVAGSYGDLAKKVWRIGHMGSQADIAMVDRALDALTDILQQRKIV
jgi:aspartate aminotransferase-like enzyme